MLFCHSFLHFVTHFLDSVFLIADDNDDNFVAYSARIADDNGANPDMIGYPIADDNGANPGMIGYPLSLSCRHIYYNFPIYTFSYVKRSFFINNYTIP